MGKLLIPPGIGGMTSDDVTASKADVLAGKTALTSDSNDEAVAGTLPDKTGTVQEGAAALDGTNARLTLTIPATGKYTAASKLFATYARIASLIGLTAAKIMKGNTILNIAGTATSDATAAEADILSGKTAYINGSKKTGTLPDKTGTVQEGAAALDSTNARVTFTIPATGKYTGTSKLFATYARIASLIGLTAAKIMKGNTILNIAGTATSDATAGDADILSGKTAYVNGSKKTGTMANVPNTSSVTLTASDGRKVIKQDASSNAIWVTGNSDNVRRALIQVPTTGYYTNSTVIGVPESRMAASGGLTAAKLLKGQSAFNIAGTATSDATAADTDILKGKTAYVNGSKKTGTMKNITGDTTIKFAASNSTPVVLADERYADNNTDGVRRMCLRYMGSNGYITGNTLFGLPAQTKTVNPSASDQNIGPDTGKLLEKVVVKGCGEAYRCIKIGTINKTGVSPGTTLISIPTDYKDDVVILRDVEIKATRLDTGSECTGDDWMIFKDRYTTVAATIFLYLSGTESIPIYGTFNLKRSDSISVTGQGMEKLKEIKKIYANVYALEQI